jgi:uncharacterized membrane protein YfcA
MIFVFLLAAVAVLAGGIAAISGFGIGSLLTPALALGTGTKVAVAAIAIPHFVATVQRFWMLRHYVDRGVLLGFGVASAIGGLVGALVHDRAASTALTAVFGVLLILAAISQLTGWMERVRWGRTTAWAAGALSGLLGGMVGNQGGIRSAAMLGFDVPKESFVATATAIAIFVDLARLPVYLISDWRSILAVGPFVLIATAGAVVGTALGTRVLGKLPPSLFRRVVALLLLLLGIAMLAAALS